MTGYADDLRRLERELTTAVGRAEVAERELAAAEATIRTARQVLLDAHGPAVVSALSRCHICAAIFTLGGES